MTDAASTRLTAGGSRVRRNRDQGISHNSSTRTSAIYNDDHLQSQTYGYGYGSLGLRSTASRYSLNDQFAATRSEFDFGFDDGASTFERSTLASEIRGPPLDDEHSPVLSPIEDYFHPSALQDRERVINPYDLLVLPPNPTDRDIRRAYFRLFTLLYPDTHPPKLRKAASVYFTLVQNAFEQTIRPSERAQEDLDQHNTSDLVLDEPGRYQVYQLWRVALSTLGPNHWDRDAVLEENGDRQSSGNHGLFANLWKYADKLGLDRHRLQALGRNGSLGLGVKLDMGSPQLFESAARGLSRFSVLNKHFLSLVPIRVTPRSELNYNFPESTQAIGAAGAWTFSAAAEPHSLGASLKYGIDVSSLQRPASQSIAPETKRTHISPRTGPGLRIEAEVSCGFVWSKFLALRCLKRIGRFSKLGFELGFSTHQLHLSLYWSRLGQRIRLPFLVNPISFISPRALFWAALVPFATLAAWDLISYCRRSGIPKPLKQVELVKQEERRSEADDITILLSANVENRQREERANRGLVILSAKYGVKKDDSWGLGEVADVTTAVAALVDNSRLRIPRNVDKNNILGFWDPVLGMAKTLHVRYLCQGKESTVEVGENEELSLPPR
ncbi:hypothetical protein TruAng_001824 [Truncatella angustata]|nr:hypothetical protein TruAng_001824 [Truncatella angustata]